MIEQQIMQTVNCHAQKKIAVKKTCPDDAQEISLSLCL